MNKTLLSVGVVALLAVGVLGVTLPKVDVANRGPQGVQGEQGPQGLAGPRGERGQTGASADLSGLSAALSSLQNLVAQLSEKKLGAVTGPNIDSQFLTVNGVTDWKQGSLFNTASNTLVALPFPNGTSTVANLLCTTKTSTSTPVYLVASVSSKPNANPVAAATSSARFLELGEVLLAANTQDTFAYRASTTLNKLSSVGMNDVVFSNTNASSTLNNPKWLVLSVTNAGGGTISQAGVGKVVEGKCRAEFKQISDN